eukprot:355515-Chlamydomonas_euryale.AAC.10
MLSEPFVERTLGRIGLLEERHILAKCSANDHPQGNAACNLDQQSQRRGKWAAVQQTPSGKANSWAPKNALRLHNCHALH